MGIPSPRIAPKAEINILLICWIFAQDIEFHEKESASSRGDIPGFPPNRITGPDADPA
jgi:hypothetical protein